MRGNWSYPTTIRFGAGRIAELPEALAAIGVKRPLFVTDAQLAQSPIAQDALARAGSAQLFADVRANPTDANLEAGIAAFRAGAHDGVIAFGGGSALDLGKLIAFMAGQNRPVWDFEDVDDWWTRADAKAIAPILAIPTTAGTGSEVGRAGVITDTKAHIKRVIFHPKMMPSLVICDPALTVGMPKHVTAGTGLDAFAHCLEAYCAPAYHPLADGIAVEGMRLVKEALLRAYHTPDDLDARAGMMSAAAMGATAFQKGLGAVHALSHPIGALYDTHHGMTNAVVLPAVLKANRPAIEDKVERLAAFLGLPRGFDGFFDFVLALRADLAVPNTLADLKVPQDRFDELVLRALEDPTAAGNPIPMTRESAASMLEASFRGAW